MSSRLHGRSLRSCSDNYDIYYYCQYNDYSGTLPMSQRRCLSSLKLWTHLLSGRGFSSLSFTTFSRLTSHNRIRILISALKTSLARFVKRLSPQPHQLRQLRGQLPRLKSRVHVSTAVLAKKISTEWFIVIARHHFSV